MAMKARPEMVRRAAITQRTLDKYVGRPFAWGRNDCARLAAFHLRGMGHKVLLTKAGDYRSAIGAAKAMRRLGHDDLAGALDAMGLERIAPAAALVGDIIAMPQDEGAPFEALTIALGNGRVLGFYGELGAAVLQPALYVTGWRVPCLKS